jgi:hypothetical protein
VAQHTRSGGRERRTERRYLIDRPGVLTSETQGVIAVRVLDLSASGARVSLPCRIPPGDEVRIEFEGHILSGVVRHCLCYGAAAFTLGIFIPKCSPAHPGSLAPRHLESARGAPEVH